jgi:hypothetical protein
MCSQQDIPFGLPPRWRAWLLLGVLAWALGQALALAHRVGHGAGHGGGLHAAHLVPSLHQVGGEHHPDDAQCRLVDQVGLGEAASSGCAVVADPAPAGRVVPGPGCRPAPLLCRLGYEARAPPRG